MDASRPTESIRVHPPRTDLVAAVTDSIGDSVCSEAQSAGGYTRKNRSPIDLKKRLSNFLTNVVAFGRSNCIRTCADKSPPRFVDHRVGQCGCEIHAQTLRLASVCSEVSGRPCR